MPRTVTALACLFWVLLLSAGAFASWRYGAFHADQLPLLGIPLGMMVLTVALGRYANRLPWRGAVLLAASALAILAGLHWGGVWGADV